MNINLVTEKIRGAEDTLLQLFLPKLIGTVFHFTTSENWSPIKASGQIATNQAGRFKTHSVHSHESVGHHLDAVCLFDFRNCDYEDLQKSTIFYDYLTRRWRDRTVYFLLIGQQRLPFITTEAELDEATRENKMYIPTIESWHRGNIPVSDIAQVYEVQALPPFALIQ